ncbi:MAG: 2Fe-2S iron-sulfur cluster-binding protein [Pontixanthobacter sp.]
MTVRVYFDDADGQRTGCTAEPGDNLLTIGQVAGLPLEGTCEGQMACSTCHVIVDPAWFDQLDPASEDEEDMLDLAFGVAPTSRLSCQIVMSATLDGLVVAVPSGKYDHSR